MTNLDPTTTREITTGDYPGVPQDLGANDDAARSEPHGFAAVQGRTVWHVNSTAEGGGVAELLFSYLRWHNREGITTRWLVADGPADFFAITKGLFFRLYSHPNNAPELTAADQKIYAEVTARHADLAAARMSAGDVAVLHDPQTLGMAPILKQAGVTVIWQCHLGSIRPTRRQAEAWDFLQPYLDAPDQIIFSNPAYPPARLADRSAIIAPAIDPHSAKNRPLDTDTVRSIVGDLGLGEPHPTAHDTVSGRAPGWAADLAVLDQRRPVPDGAPVLVQVSRWDETKGVLGVLRAFTDLIAVRHPELHLVLLGPDPNSVADDPGGQLVFDQVADHVHTSPAQVADRVHLVRTAGTDLEGTAFIVNAVQQWATYISQKSLCEGFGLTVTEGKWKSKPVIAAAVGGIPSQLEDGTTGLLVPDSHDLPAFAAAVDRLVGDQTLGERLGARARDDVAERFLFPRQLGDYLRVYASVLG